VRVSEGFGGGAWGEREGSVVGGSELAGVPGSAWVGSSSRVSGRVGALVKERGMEYGRAGDGGAQPGSSDEFVLNTELEYPEFKVDVNPDSDPTHEPELTPTPDLDTIFGDPEAQDTETLGESIVTLSAHLHAGNHRLLVMVAEFDRRGGWKPAGHRSCAHWLAFRTGISLGPARERVRAARALENLPLTSEAMSRGELSFSKVRALSRVADDLATPDEEETLVEFARQCTAAQLETMVRGWKKLCRKDEIDLERERHRSRFFSVSPDEDGMYLVRGRLDPEVGALLMRALEAAGDALFRSERDWAPEGAAMGPAVREITPRQRRADGMGLLVEQALRVGLGALVDGGAEGDVDADDGEASERGTTDGPRSVTACTEGVSAECSEERVAGGTFQRGEARPENVPAEIPGEAPTPTAGESAESATSKDVPEHPGTPGGRCDCGEGSVASPEHVAPLSGTRAERYQVMLHVDMVTLRAGNGEVAVDGCAKVGGAGDGEVAAGPCCAEVPITNGTRPTDAPSHTHFLEHAPGRSHLADGTRVSAETSRRLCCDAAVVEATRGPNGEVLDVGRRTRTIPPALRRALEIRDGGCRFPGCGLRFGEGHHIVHWADGGETKLSNLVLLCRFHHRAVHEEGFSVKVVNDRIRFFDRTGWPLPDAAPPPPLKDPFAGLLATHRREGVRPHGYTPSARWKRAQDIPWELEARAHEALDS